MTDSRGKRQPNQPETLRSSSHQSLSWKFAVQCRRMAAQRSTSSVRGRGLLRAFAEPLPRFIEKPSRVVERHQRFRVNDASPRDFTLRLYPSARVADEEILDLDVLAARAKLGDPKRRNRFTDHTGLLGQ